MFAPLETKLHTFHPTHFGPHARLVRELREHGGRRVACVCCSELGVAPESLCGGQPGELYAIQNAGGIVTLDRNRVIPSVEVSIDYALGVQEVEHIIVCGHSHCAFVREAAATERRPAHALSTEFRAILAPVAERYTDCSCEALDSVLVQEHVLLQLEALTRVPSVARRLSDGSLKLYGWVVDDDTARVHSFNVETGQFECLSPACSSHN